MTKKLLFVTTILLALVCAAMAADITGKWSAEQPGRNGGPPRVTTFAFKVDGGKLTGTVSMPGRGGQSMDSEITDGKVDGNNISFKTSMTMGDQTRTSEYSGTVGADSISLKVTRPGRDGNPMTVDLTLKKATT